MGVPITFMQHYNPAQCDIIGASESEGKGFSIKNNFFLNKNTCFLICLIGLPRSFITIPAKHSIYNSTLSFTKEKPMSLRKQKPQLPRNVSKGAVISLLCYTL